MYDSDPMVNGKIMRERHQELIRRVKHESLAHEIKNAGASKKLHSPLHAILTALINLVTR
jgi:hypothetical protein